LENSGFLENAIDYLEGNDRMKAEMRRSKKKAKKRAPKKLPPYMTVAEKDRFFRAVGSHPLHRAVYRLMYHHGLRASEISVLQFSDYRPAGKLEMDRIYIHRLKGSISGECTLMPAAALAIRAWVRQRGTAQGPLFTSQRGNGLSRIRVFEIMQKYSRAADIPPEKCHPHSLKHTCCTHLISVHKESIMDVQKHVGHVNIQNTMIYAKLTSEADNERARRLQKWS